MRILGIDPGINGAWALMEHRAVLPWHVRSVNDFPTVLRGKKGRKVSAKLLYDEWVTLNWDIVIFEQVHAMPEQGVTSSLEFGRAAGIIEGVAAVFGKPVHFVSPQKWKRVAGLIKAPKDLARTKAIETFPEAAHKLSRKKDHNRAEAILSAWYGTQVEL